MPAKTFREYKTHAENNSARLYPVAFISYFNSGISRVREIITAATTFSHRTLLSYLHRVDGKRAGFPYCINR